MKNAQPVRVKTISEYHRAMGLRKPEHPLISLVNMEAISQMPGDEPTNWFFDFYSISLKRNPNTRIIYGQQEYDFDEGVMFFISPGQVFGIEVEKGADVKRSGWILLIHPDFLWNTPLAKAIKQYEFFDYAVHEALFLSEKEEATIIGMMQSIEQEYQSRIDKFSQEIIIAQIELLLKHAERFYHRQFITRRIANHQMLSRLEDLLNNYFDGDAIVKNGLPSVTWVAGNLNVSAGYLSGLLKVLTGLNTQQHIHQKLIDKAKEKLSTSGLSVSEIAYELGFEHPQSFSKLFKTKTNLSPLEFRHSFN
jgi:AraC family transcriptional activator of pobA